jgi:hypothetical protein
MRLTASHITGKEYQRGKRGLKLAMTDLDNWITNVKYK